MIRFEPERFLQGNPISVAVIAPQGQLVVKEDYVINKKHRDNTPQKAQWSIGERDEVEMFGWSLETDSQCRGYYWGVSLHGGICRTVGVSIHGNPSKIARFVSSVQPRVWHGYPVDYKHDPQHDCPSRTVLMKWAKMNIITKSQIAKLIGGQGWKD